MPSARQSGGDALPGNTGKKARKEKRQLVRWDQDLDTLLLLTVQSACNLTGVKVPWQKVAKLMGPKFTEGAIVQHLSKLRIRRESAGQRVPPPLRRSVTAAAAASGGGKIALKSVRKNTRKRKGRSDMLDDDSSDGLDAQEVEDSDPEYIQNKKKQKTRRPAPKKTKLGLKNEDDDDGDDTLLCKGASFLRHMGPALESDYEGSDLDESDDDEDAAFDLEDEFDFDSYAAKVKVEETSTSPHLSHIIKLPVSLHSRDQDAMKSIRSVAANTPPPSSRAGTWTQSYPPIDPALMNNPPGPTYGPQSAWYPTPMATTQGNENPFQSGPGHMYWPMPTPVVNNRILPPSDFTWSPHAPAFASGRGGTLAVSGHPAPTWGPSSTTADEAPSQSVDTGSWFLNSHVFDSSDENDAKETHGQDQGLEEY